MRASAAPVIDGKDNDQVWQTAPEITGFKQWRPSEGKAPRYKTEAKIAYDAANLYVFVRAFDPHPDSIIKLLERRDSYTSSDMFWLFIDSYHDRRTGYEFGVNAAGVKTDAAIYDDGNEDFAWDGVWDVATRIDSLGWTAEYRIPLSQMRYSSATGRIPSASSSTATTIDTRSARAGRCSGSRSRDSCRSSARCTGWTISKRRAGSRRCRTS